MGLHILSSRTDIAKLSDSIAYMASWLTGSRESCMIVDSPP